MKKQTRRLRRRKTMNTILEFLEKILNWFVESGLAEKTADALARIITFDGVELDRLMWEWINTIFGGAI